MSHERLIFPAGDEELETFELLLDFEQGTYELGATFAFELINSVDVNEVVWILVGDSCGLRCFPGRDEETFELGSRTLVDEGLVTMFEVSICKCFAGKGELVDDGADNVDHGSCVWELAGTEEAGTQHNCVGGVAGELESPGHGE